MRARLVSRPAGGNVQHMRRPCQTVTIGVLRRRTEGGAEQMKRSSHIRAGQGAGGCAGPAICSCWRSSWARGRASPAAATPGHQAASPSSGGAIKTGGVLKVGVQPGNVKFDPALFAGAVADILLQQQIYEKLVTWPRTSPSSPRWPPNGTPPTARSWTLHAARRGHLQQRPALHRRRRGLHDGPPGSKKLGSPMAERLRQHQERVAADPTHVTFHSPRSTRSSLRRSPTTAP